MQVSVSGIQVDVGEAFQNHVNKVLKALHGKHNIDPIEVKVQLSKEAHQFRSDITSHLGAGVVMRSHCLAIDPHTSFDGASDNLSKRLRRHKGRLDAYHKHHGTRREKQMVPYYVIQPGETAEEAPIQEDASPPIIAEIQAEVPTITVSDAVMQLDLSQEPAMLFYNKSHGGLNMVYLRSDGNIGWVDPQNTK
ncbi:MAG: ribosome-associated translation inhibitor RaiA [Pseudomonadota bacterium]